MESLSLFFSLSHSLARTHTHTNKLHFQCGKVNDSIENSTNMLKVDWNEFQYKKHKTRIWKSNNEIPGKNFLTGPISAFILPFFNYTQVCISFIESFTFCWILPILNRANTLCSSSSWNSYFHWNVIVISFNYIIFIFWPNTFVYIFPFKITIIQFVLFGCSLKVLYHAYGYRDMFIQYLQYIAMILLIFCMHGMQLRPGKP